MGRPYRFGPTAWRVAGFFMSAEPSRELAPETLKLAVTGAAGYLGAEVACRAAAQGHYVRAVVKHGQPVEHLSACSEVHG